MIYIKRQSVSLLLALTSLSLTSLVSCSESNGLSGVTLSDKKISFTATEVNGWTPNSGSSSSSNDETTRAMSSVGSYHPLIVKSDLGKPLYLHPVEQVGTYFYNDKDELVTRSGVPLSEISNQNRISTRGTKVTEIGDEILVSAVSKKNNVEAGYFSFEKATKSGNIWHISKDEYWTTDATLSFYAYAPTNASMLSTSDSELSGYRTVHYIAGTGDDIKSQPDFIVAKSEDNQRSATDAASAVDLHFSHALTAVTFAVGKDMVPGKISNITVRGVKGEGDYNIATNTWNTDNVVANAEYTIDNLGPNGDGTITGEKDVALTNNNQTLLMIPQSLGSDAEVEIVFDNDNGAKTLTASLSGTSWEAGHSIIYKLSASEVTTLSLGNIEFPTNWSSNYATGKLKSAYDGTEKVGLFVVDDQGYIRNANVQLTYNSSTKSWSLPKDVNMLFSPRFKYFAYCNPTSTDFSSNLPQAGTTVTNITDAASFFNDAISAWSPSFDQSTLAKLNACDLQIGMANISSTASSIDFNMTHAMGLADITLGEGLKYELSDKTYDWTTVIVSDKFVDNIPCELSYNRYVAIVKPNIPITFNATAKGWKGAWKEKLSYSPSMAEIEAHTAVREDDEKHSYTLALGDMFYKDGGVTHNEDDLQPSVVNPAVGIVAYLSDGSSNNKWVETGTTSSGGGHALVMGLKTIGSTGTYAEAIKNYNYSNESAAAKAYRGTRCLRKTTQTSSGSQSITTASAVLATKTTDYGSGYIQTARLWNDGSTYPAFGLTKTYNLTNPAPSKTTGWFIPTAGQWYAMIILGVGEAGDCTWNVYNGTNLDGFVKRNGVKTHITDPINKALSKVGDGNYTVLSGALECREWTSSEYDYRRGVFMNNGVCNYGINQSIGAIGFGRINNDEVGTNNYNGTPQVRPFLAF